MGISAAAVRHRIRMVILENGSFLLDGEFAVSTCVGARGDVVSPGGNNFYDFSSLSSFISCHVLNLAYVALIYEG
jgi:hypothetical protein